MDNENIRKKVENSLDMLKNGIGSVFTGVSQASLINKKNCIICNAWWDPSNSESVNNKPKPIERVIEHWLPMTIIYTICEKCVARIDESTEKYLTSKKEYVRAYARDILKWKEENENV
jgi:hypothetical protein